MKLKGAALGIALQRNVCLLLLQKNSLYYKIHSTTKFTLLKKKMLRDAALLGMPLQSDVRLHGRAHSHLPPQRWPFFRSYLVAYKASYTSSLRPHILVD